MESLFDVGDKIICIDSSGNGAGLVEGKSYIVMSLVQCPKCKLVAVNVGIKNHIVNHSGLSECVPCGARFPAQTIGYNSYKQTRFVKAEDNHALEEQIHQAMKGNLIEN